MTQAEAFRIDVSERALLDLRDRLARTRWPDEVADAGWDYGVPLSFLKDLVTYWQERFDWRSTEQTLNSFHHFRARIEGLEVHFVHERGRGPEPMPLILTHGWPGSFLELLPLVPLLTDPASQGGSSEDAFDVVIPSLPGYGFSERPPRRGMLSARIASMWNGLMTDVLGYESYGAHGGDIGSRVTTRLGQHHADRVVGIHITAVEDPPLGPDSPPLTQAESEFLRLRDAWYEAEGGYSHIQRTKPQTLAYGLSDSPAGLAAWILEKYRTWSDCAGDVERRFGRDWLLTAATLYWVTETIPSSMRLYFERRRDLEPFAAGERIAAPAGVSLFPNELVAESHPPREWVERLYDLRHFARMPRGGHFPALEEPALLADELRSFFRPLRARPAYSARTV